MAALRLSARDPLPALSFPLAGPQLPAAPRGLRPQSGRRGYAPPLFCRLRRQTHTAGCSRWRVRAVCLRVGRDGRALTCWRVGRARVGCTVAPNGHFCAGVSGVRALLAGRAWPRSLRQPRPSACGLRFFGRCCRLARAAFSALSARQTPRRVAV